MDAPRIVVGVDGSANSRAALRWALAEAQRRAAEVVAVIAWEPTPLYGAGLGTGVGAATVFESAERNAKKVLESAVAEVLAEHPAEVAVHREVVCGSPAPALLEAARDADLLVVGARGHGGFAGLLVGSVASQVTHHASLPVVIVPAGRAESDASA